MVEVDSLETQIGRVGRVLSHSSVQVGESLCARPEPHLRTQVVSTAFALSTALAAHTNLHSDSVTDFKGRSGRLVGPKGGDNSAGLVAENERLADLEDTVGTVVVVV